jgi:proline iminopeptidase
MMTALASCLTDNRINVDVARQVRVWSGTLFDDKDFEEAVQEILPIYAPPENSSRITAVQRTIEPKSFEGLDPKSGRTGYHSATQNAAFSVNQPQFDVRYRLKEIKVSF